MPIEQAIYLDGIRARSPGFEEGWLGAVEALCRDFGERPSGVRCPLALFARPLGRRHVAVVRAADEPYGVLAFHLLVLPVKLYAELGGDPFLICDKLPASFTAQGDLPSLEWTAGPPPRRSVDDVRRILDVVAERTQTLLGGAQVLVDGGKLVCERQAPDPAIVRELWALLPDATRAELWPTTFAFGNRLGFHVAVVLNASGPEYASYVREADAGDYPEGRYEFALQQAAEQSDQGEIDALFSRRSRSQMLRLAVILLLAFLIIPPLVLHPGCGGPEAPRPERKEADRE